MSETYLDGIAPNNKLSLDVYNRATEIEITGSGGLPGARGEKGERGDGLKIDGTVNSYVDLPTKLTTDDAGKTYLNRQDNKLYTWSGTDFPLAGKGFQVQGEKGERGARGEKGERGERGLPGEKGKDGKPGEKGKDGDTIPINVVADLPTTGKENEIYILEKKDDRVETTIDVKDAPQGNASSAISVVELGTGNDKLLLMFGRTVATVPGGAGMREGGVAVTFPVTFKTTPVVVSTTNDIGGVVGEFNIAMNITKTGVYLVAGRTAGSNGEEKVGIEWIAVGQKGEG